MSGIRLLRFESIGLAILLATLASCSAWVGDEEWRLWEKGRTHEATCFDGDCDSDSESDSDSATDSDPDVDSDGWTVGEGDCDDDDPDVHPGESETVGDGIDANCDGEETCYVDGDDDGFRTMGTVISTDEDCSDPGEALSEDPSDDCEDDDPGIHPGESETVGDGIDANCDGEETCYVDGDDDGFRTMGTVISTDEDCSDPGEALSTDPSDDCDDANLDINPGEAETVGDGIDANCDGEETCYVDVDGDGYRATGTVVSTDEDCSDSGEALSSNPSDDCDDNDPAMLSLCMVLIPSGIFTMGSPSGEVGRYSTENQHEVTLTGSFYMGVHEVTQAEFEEFMDYQPSYYCGCDDCPAENMSWYEAAAFANAVSRAAGLDECYSCDSGEEDSVICSSSWSPYPCEGYRLPTEAEWEYAARQETTSAFSNGGNLYSGDEAVCDGSVLLDNGTYLDNIAVYCGNDSGEPAEVSTKYPNPWGLYDMHGNVWEWCNGWWDGSAYSGDDETDPWGDTIGSDRVIRGGSWYSNPRNLRSALRGRYAPGDGNDNLGFRLARSD